MRDFKLAEYRTDVEKLLRYIPWLEEKKGKSVSSIYNNNDLSKSTISFPVFDSTLLGFVKEVQGTGLIDTNYVYVYSEHRIKTAEDELREIDEAGVKEAAVITGILSKYVLGGNTKGSVWNEGVENGVMLACLLRLKKLLEIWDSPLA